MTVQGELACRDAPSQYELSSHGALSRTPLGKLNYIYRRLSYRRLSYRRLSYALTQPLDGFLHLTIDTPSNAIAADEGKEEIAFRLFAAIVNMAHHISNSDVGAVEPGLAACT